MNYLTNLTRPPLQFLHNPLGRPFELKGKIKLADCLHNKTFNMRMTFIWLRSLRYTKNESYMENSGQKHQHTHSVTLVVEVSNKHQHMHSVALVVEVSNKHQHTHSVTLVVEVSLKHQHMHSVALVVEVSNKCILLH